jgi:hypothetical protein
MSKNIIFSIVGVVVIATGAYFVINSKNDDVGGSEKGGMMENKSGKKMAFSEFVKQGGSYECTVNQNVGGTDTKGTTFISGGNIRGEYNTKTQGMSIDTNFIVKDGYSYTWTSMMPNVGFKSKVVASTDTNANAPTSGQYSFNAEQIGDYECKAWSADESKFAIPSTIKFQDMSGK